ncbi:MAG: ribosome maturation factor RimP [Candidatus Zixiibacteriota bacterium]
MFDEIKQRVRELIEKPLRDEGCELVDIVLARYKSRWTLKVFIFTEGGTTIGECTRISQIVGDIIDGTNLFDSGYTLEVSSPGLDRPLKEPRDFKYRVGETVTIDFVDPKKEKIRAEILSASDMEIQLKNSAGVFTVGLDEIEKATIVY